MRNWNFNNYPFQQYPSYRGTDLGINYYPEYTSIKIWAPTAKEIIVRIFPDGVNNNLLKMIQLVPTDLGCWDGKIEGDWKNHYYTIQVQDTEGWLNQIPDINAKAVGLNGNRGMIIDLNETNPEDWEKDHGPTIESPTDCVLYETHVRDFSIHPDSGMIHKGKFLAFTEEGTYSPLGIKTGLDHLTELGITHLHLLPIADFHSIDEDSKDPLQYNWGYDPQNFNTPDGWYATNPYDGKVRIREFKELVKKVHQKGIGIVLDVVYNHTGLIFNSVFNQTVPGYYYRQREDGTFSDASGCGTELATERLMVRKFILESVKYWVTEYHIDGFRFDLMGIFDIETMNQISDELKKINPNILIYGEGWTAGASPYPKSKRAVKQNISKLENIAAFCDDIRDGLKGHWGSHESKGFISGKTMGEEQLKFGIAGAVHHPQIVYHFIESSKEAWAKAPTQCVNYVSCHDNYTLFDKLKISCPDATEEEYIKMVKLALAVILTSQGIPFLHSGVEFLRTKYLDGNSYKSPDWVNWLDWNRKKQYFTVFEFCQKLIAFRKHHASLRFSTAEEIQKNLKFLEPYIPGVVAYELKKGTTNDPFNRLIIILNGNKKTSTVPIPIADWQVLIHLDAFDENGLKNITRDRIKIPATSMLVLGERDKSTLSKRSQ